MGSGGSWQKWTALTVGIVVSVAALAMSAIRTANLNIEYVPGKFAPWAWLGALCVEGMIVFFALRLLDTVEDTSLQRVIAISGLIAGFVISGTSQIIDSSVLRGISPSSEVEWLLFIVVPLEPTIAALWVALFELAGALQRQIAGGTHGRATRSNYRMSSPYDYGLRLPGFDSAPAARQPATSYGSEEPDFLGQPATPGAGAGSSYHTRPSTTNTPQASKPARRPVRSAGQKPPKSTTP